MASTSLATPTRFERLVAALQAGDRGAYAAAEAASDPRLQELLAVMDERVVGVVLERVASFLPPSTGIASSDLDALSSMMQTLSLMGGGAPP